MVTRAEQKVQTRATLLAAARAVLKRQGLAGTTTRAVALEAGVAVGTVFVHFPDVDHLVEALLDEHLAVAVERAVHGASQHAASKRGDLVAQLVHVAKGLFDSYAVEPELSKAFLAASLFGGAPGGLAESRLAAFEAWVSARIAEAIARRQVPAVDPGLAFATYFSLYFGALVAGLRGRLSRRQQVHLLDQALRRFFRVKEAGR